MPPFSADARGMRLLLAVGVLAVHACARPVAPPPAPPPAPRIIPELPPLPIQTVVSLSDTSEAARLPGGEGRITLTSSNADLRDLLPLLASAAGVNLVMGPEVRGRVSVRFQNARAVDALYAVIQQAGLIIGPPGPELPWSKSVFYDLPVNINNASAATIQARFGISAALADWTVRSAKFP